MSEPVERRQGQWTERVVAGFGIGTPLAVLAAWSLNEFTGIRMPETVSAALGGVITAVSVCVSAVFMRICPILFIAFKRWMLRR